MPAKWFICPDGEHREINDCLNKGCPIASQLPGGRCLSRPTLALIGENRPWKGIPSTTQLLNGTMKSMLEILFDYAVNPLESLWAVHGTAGHGSLGRHTDNALTEERLTDDICSGQPDLYEDEILYDYKFWGAYKIARATGLEQIEVQDGVYKKSGKWGKAGDPKMVKKWVHTGNTDLFNEEMQLNDYRMKLERIGFPVKEMLIQALARDAGTWFAEQQRGITQAAVLIPIRRLPDEEVRTYFKGKRDALLGALESNILPAPCNDKECWEGRRCAKYCAVADRCPKGQKLKEVSDYGVA